MEEEWNGDAVQKAHSTGAWRNVMPQRQQNPENAAVVEEEWNGDAVQKAHSVGAWRDVMPQRQQNPENAAVVESGRGQTETDK